MMQSKLALSILITGSLISSLSNAQDIPKDKDMLNPAYTWTGWYAGLNAGLVNHRMNITDNQATSFFATIEQVTNPQFTGGLQAGYRRQMDFNSVSGVYGLEASVNFSDAQFQKTYGSPFGMYQLNAYNSLKNVGLLQLIGGIAADKTFLFLAAGLSWTNVSGSVINVSGAPFFDGFSVSNSAVGTALGGGIEYALTDRISLRLKVDVIKPDSYTTYNEVADTYDVSDNVVQSAFAVNYKFG